MTDNLKTIYEGLAGKNPALKEYGYDAFAKDMQVPENLEKVYKGLATKNKQIAEYGFENFQKDMFGEPQQESVKKSLSNEQESLKQAFRENPRSAMGMPIDTAKQIVGDVVDEQFTDERGFKGFGKELVNRGARGAEELNQMLINAPNTFMRVINAPFNTLYRAIGLPEVDPQTFNKITGLDKVSDDIDKKKEFYTQRIKELNPYAEKSVTQAAKEGDWVTFTRNLAGGVADSFAPSMAMMLSGGTMGAPAMIGSGALLFGSGKLKEIDEASPDMPENLKLLVAGANGALEGIFETYLGSGAVGGAIRELALREGRDAARRTVMEGLRQGFSKVLADRPMLAPLGEGFEEMGTQIAQNYVDKVSGYRPDIDVTDGVLDAGLIGVASGLSHTPFIGVPRIMNKWSRNQQLTDDTQQTPNIDPVEAVRTDIRSTVQTRSHDSGNIVMSYLEGVGPVFIRSGQYENGKFNDPDGMIIYYDRNGNPGAAGQEFFSGDVQEFTPEQFEEMEVGRFQTELERRKIAQEQAVEIGGQYFVPTGQMDDEGNHIIVPLDQNMNPVEAQATTMAPEQFEKVFQAKQVQEQAVEEGKLKPEVKKTTWGKNEYQYTLNEDGTADVLIPNSINPESAFKEIQNAFKDNARFEAVPITETREIPAKDDFSDPTTESILTGIKIVPKQIATPVTSQDNKKTEKQAEPKYTFNKENLSREEVSEMINLAEDPNELNGLRIDNDPELQQMLLSKFPDKAPRLSIAGQEATEAQVKARIRLGKNLNQIQIENSPELQTLLDKKVKELTKSEKNVSNSLQNVPETTTGTPVNATNVTQAQEQMLPKNETATEGQSTNLETQRAEIERRRQEELKQNYETDKEIESQNDAEKGIKGVAVQEEIKRQEQVDPQQEKEEQQQTIAESTEWNIGDILTYANGEKFTITQIGKTANGDKHLYTAESEGGGLIRVTSDNSNIVEVEKKESNSTKYIIPIETAIENAPKKAEIKKEEKKVEPNPSEAQKEAGNYQKGHIKVQGFDISIENSKGSKRSGTDKSGKKWEQTMNNTYGYFKRTKGKDGDQIDTFIGNNPETGKIFVVDQFIDGKFDEHKVMLGFNSEEEAREAYLSNYEKGWQGLGNITEVSHQDFKEWLKDGTRTDKPFAETRVVIKADNPQDATPLEKKLEEIAEEKKPKETPLEKGLRQFNESPDKERSLKILKENIAELKKSIDVLGSTKDKQNKLNEAEQLLDAINKSNKKQEKEEAGRTVMYRRVSDIGFYSTVEDALEKISQEKGTPEQFKAMLLKNGAKQAEMDWMGFDEFAEGKKSVTKTEIQDWINQNRIEVEEVINGINKKGWFYKGNPDKIYDSKEKAEMAAGQDFANDDSSDEYYDEDGELLDKYYEDVEEFIKSNTMPISEAIGKNLYDIQNNTKYSQYQLPGGKNYKEVLLTMPVKDKELKKLENKYGEKWLTEATSDEIQKVQKENKGQGTFKSSHFDEPNILAHIRFNERTDSKGNKVLFIEEIQSDWAQKGKKEGFNIEPNKIVIEDESQIPFNTRLQYRRDGNFGSLIIENDLVNTVNGPKYPVKYYYSAGGFYGSGFISFEEIKNLELFDENSRPYQTKIPSMPFKNTDQWVNLALRRMIRYAAENNFDRIAWTPGEQQAERYDLSKQVDRIDYFKESNKIAAYRNGLEVINKSATPDELPDIVGKEVAKKLLQEENTMDGNTYSLRGNDLKVGGEGMKAFYDAIIPSAASKLGKPFGAKIESIQIDVNPKITDKEKSASNDKYATIQSIPITESMRESVKRGVPLFRQYDIDSAVSDANDKISSAKTLDEKHSVILETVEAIESVFGEISNVITSKNEKEFFELLETEGLSESKINEIKKDFEDSRKGKTIIPGLMIDGNIYLISDNIANYNDLIETWLHEKSHTIIRKEFTRDELIELAKELGDQEMSKVLPKEDHKLAPQHKADETISYTISNFLKENNLQDVLTGNVDIDNLPLSLQYAVNRVLTRFNEYGKSNNQIKDRGQRNTLSRTDGKTSLRGIPENQIRESGNRRQGSIETGQRTPLERRLAEIAANSAAKNNRKALKHSPTFIDERLESGSYMPEKIVVDGVERHTRNSNGQLIHPTRRGIENFWKWFGDSKVVDEQGRPLVVYHGTANEITEFKGSNETIAKNRLAKKGAIFFTDNYLVAEGYAKSAADYEFAQKYGLNIAENGNINANNEFIENYENEIIKYNDIEDWDELDYYDKLEYAENYLTDLYNDIDSGFVVQSYLKLQNPKLINFNDVKEEFEGNITDLVQDTDIENDQDGIVINNAGDFSSYAVNIMGIPDVDLENLPTTYVAISPSQIKSSTGNNGNFNPNNPDIRYRRTSPVTPLERAAERSVYNKTDKRSMGEVIDGMKEYYYEKDLPINTWQKNILTNGGKIDQKYDPYKTKKRAPGRLEYLVDTYMKDYFEPIEKVVAEIVKKTGVERSYIVPYLISKHAPERNATIRNQKIDEYAKAEQWKLELWIKNTDPEQSEIDKRQKNLDERIEKYREELSGIDFSGILPFTENQDGSNDYEGRPDELAQEIVNDFEGKIGKDLSDKLWEAVNKATGAVLEAQVASNWMTDKEADGYRDRWKYYIPLRGWLEDAAKTFNYINNGKGGRTMQHAGGRQSVAENPLGYLVHIAHKAYQEQVDMEVKNALLKTVVLNRNNDFKNLHNVKRAYFYKDGTDPVTGETLWRISTEKPTDDQIDNGEAVIESFGEHMKLRKKEHGLQHEVFVRSEHGNFIVVFPNNPEVAQAFNNENYMYRTLLGGKKADSRSENSFVETKIDLGPLGSWSLRNFTNFIKGMFTQYNIQFVVNNFPRDLFESNIDSYILDNNPFGVAYNTKRGIQSIDRYLRGKKTNDEALIKQFYSLGGATGHTHNLTPEEYVEKVNKEIDMLIKGGNLHRGKVEIAKWLTRWNQRFEDGVRYSVFLNQLALGKSPEEAAFRARNATVDFNIRGKGSPWLGTLWAFFEVSANSLAKGTSYFTKTPYTNIAKPGNRRRAAAVAGTFLAIGFIEAMINDIADDDDDEKDYYNRSAWMRHNYLNFPIGGNKYITLALPQFWRGFKAMGAVLYDYSIGQRGKLTAGKAIAQIASNFMAGLSPVDIGSAFAGDEFRPLSPFVPAFLRPIYELSINRDFTDRKIAIEPFTEQQKRDLAKSGLHGKNVNTAIKFFTDTWFKFGGGDNETKVYTDPKTGEQKRVSWFMDINPAQVEHLIKGYMGGTYTFLSNMVNTGYQMASSEEDVDFRNVPFVTAFIRKTPESKWKTIEEWYNNKDGANDFKVALKAYKKQAYSGDKEAEEKYRITMQNNYNQEYNKLIEGYSGIINELAKNADYQKENGMNDVVNLMKEANKAIEDLKDKYSK